jgi:hypothetical protein
VDISWQVPTRGCILNNEGKYIIKKQALCDAKAFYCCSFDDYLGKVNNVSDINCGQQVRSSFGIFWKVGEKYYY